MFANIFPNLLNFTNITLYDLIQMVVIIILAIAAISVGVIAGRLNDQTVESNLKTAELAQQTAHQSKMMQQTEMNIAFTKQIIEIYNFFVKDIFIKNFFHKDNEDLLRERCNEILFQSLLLFNQEIYEVIETSIHKILEAYTDGIRAFTDEEYAKAKNNLSAGIEIKIYEAFMNRENNAEDTIKSYETMLRRTVFLSNIRDDITGAFGCFKINLGPERIDSL